jgi:hypothetical protein
MSDYKTKFNEYVSGFVEAVREGAFEDRSERITAVELLVERYVTAHGERPDNGDIERLTNVILNEELTDKNTYKVSHEEYPILSNYQFDTRHQEETSLKQAEEYDTGGVNRAKPVRRKRSKYENMTVDKYARARNKERRRRYREFTKEQPVIIRKVAPAEIERYLNEKYTFYQRKYA